VQKYGGTSLGTKDKQQHVAALVASYARERQVVPVVSAISADSKEGGTTSQLLRAMTMRDRDDRRALLGRIEALHLDLACDAAARDGVRMEMTDVSILCDVAVQGSGVSADAIIRAGETMSAQVLASSLRTHAGANAVAVDLRTLATFRDVTTAQRRQLVRTALAPLLDADVPTIPVVTGFFGHTARGMMCTVGRGYTDYTAALCAAAVGAETLQIWKESGGIFSAHPKWVPDARLLHEISMDEAQELALFGNDAIHPAAVRCLKQAGIGAQVLHVHAPNEPGTRVRIDMSHRQSGRPAVTAVCGAGVTVLDVRATDDAPIGHCLDKLFAGLAAHHLAPELVSTSVGNVSVAVRTDAVDGVEAALDALTADVASFGDMTLRPGRAVVSLVGANMRDHVGLAAEACAVLAAQNINLEMLSQSCSEINLSVVIKEEDLAQGVRALHDYFCVPADGGQDLSAGDGRFWPGWLRVSDPLPLPLV
jgi:aspartate kinase